jgi:hypothetical protein
VRSLRLLLSYTTVAATVFTAACSGADNAAPVASVTVTAAKTRTPVGSPVELTYRFELTGDPISDDYTVFTHFVNADGEAIWNDDHEPPVPTSTWKPGQVVEYTRTRFLPALLQPGDVTIEVGLYRGAERLPLSSSRPPRSANARAYPVGDVTIAPESENVFLIYQAGWHPDDFVQGDPYGSSKWTQQSATLVFRNPRTDATLLLEYAARPDAFKDGPQEVTIVGAGNQPITTFTADSSEIRIARIPISSAQMGAADMAELRIDVNKTFVPAQLGTAERDTRVLGLRIYHAFIESR